MLLPAVAASRLVLVPFRLSAARRISSLKVPWKRDPALDAAIARDRRFLQASRLVREVLLSPGRRLLFRYLTKRRERIKLPVHVPTFLKRYPTLLAVSAPPEPVASPSPHLLAFLDFASRLYELHAPLLASRLAKLLMISSTRALPVTKIAAAKRYFGIRPRPNFTVKLPKGFYLKKEMREWVRDWLELPYISPYADASGLHPASPEAEKRSIGVLHEVLSLTVERRMAVPIIGKFCDEYRLPNAFANAFTRHPGIFYVSLKGGIKTAVLREAYDENGELIDRDPMLELKERFVAIMEEGHKQYLEDLKRKREALQKDREDAGRQDAKAEIEDRVEEEWHSEASEGDDDTDDAYRQ
uniref:PORR domain-containing protein n=1 Tax=Zea mays TaxID=4577 RepID=A0A804M8F2_MAIZE